MRYETKGFIINHHCGFGARRAIQKAVNKDPRSFIALFGQKKTNSGVFVHPLFDLPFTFKGIHR